MTRHELKVHPQFWEALTRGAKPFEIRRNDRRFKVGDTCELRRYDPSSIGFTGERMSLQITYVLAYEDFPVGLQPGYVALGFGVHPNFDDNR
jgi:hypothetical protein